MSIREGQSENIQFSDHHGNITVLYFLINHGEDDRNIIKGFPSKNGGSLIILKYMKAENWIQPTYLKF